jgi:16S rRNA (cytidine1402-2'-O)-methyltransferase
MGTLQVVATPIGNLEDVTLRALRALAQADLVLAEDTRRTRILLERHRIEARPVSLHAHNEQSRIERVLQVLEDDGCVALVSDAGTPLLSDPGERLVEAVLAAGHRVEALPGASAVLAALAVSGLSPQPFSFVGFLPRRAGERAAVLARYADREETLVLFESPKRLAKTLLELADALGDRRACVARELTKIHEEARRGTLLELADVYASGTRGEVTLVVEGAAPGARDAEFEARDPAELDAQIRARLADGAHAKEIASALVSQTGLARRTLYARVIRVRNEVASDAASGSEDAASESEDAGCEPEDAGCEPEDAGCEPEDAGCEPEDAGCEPEDAGCEPERGA